MDSKRSKVMVLLLALTLLGGSLAIPEESEVTTMTQGPRLFRVILPVSDIERATKYYSELLGAEGRRISPGRHYFDCGGVILAVFDPRADGDPVDAKPNPDHIYFAVPDLESFYERAQRLGGLSPEKGDAGQPMGRMETRPWGERSFYLKDPFGNPLCFVDEKTVFTGR